jgi:hypothetical protein
VVAEPETEPEPELEPQPESEPEAALEPVSRQRSEPKPGPESVQPPPKHRSFLDRMFRRH